MSKRFVFFSWQYAFGTAMGLLFVASLVALSVMMGTWMFALIGLVPAAGCIYLARRTRVSIALEGDVLSVLAGVGPRRIVQLPPGQASTSEAPYRGAPSRVPDRGQLDIVDHAEVDGPVIKENTRLTRVVGAVLRALRFALADEMGGLAGPSVREQMGRLRVSTATGAVRTFIIPAEGEANETKLKALQAALNPAVEESGA